MYPLCGVCIFLSIFDLVIVSLERIGIEVMKMLEYDRSTIAWPVTPNSNSKSAVDKYTHTLPWVPPSPNIPTPATVLHSFIQLCYTYDCVLLDNCI